MEITFREYRDVIVFKIDKKTYKRIEQTAFDIRRENNDDNSSVDWYNEKGGKVRKATAEKLEKMFDDKYI